MLFHKKKEDHKEVPIEDVQKMTKKGMSDKDIIKHLKGKGYSYEAIEKAMLKAVKEGVDDEAPKAISRMDTEPPAADVFEPMEEFSPPDFGQQPLQELGELPEEMEAPDLMLEELIEGVVEEKWRKFDDRFRKVDDHFDKIKAEIKQFEMRMENMKKESPHREFDSRMAGISEQLEDLEARVGGLEKAFKQFLPSLTRNIESLSGMIHEMKDKQALNEIE